MTDKPINNRAWFFVLPVLGFVLFSSIIPAMTVVNYSIQDTMGANNFFWNGDAWFRDLLNWVEERRFIRIEMIMRIGREVEKV